MTVYTGSIARARSNIAKKGDVCIWRQWTIEAGDEDWTEDEDSEHVDYTVVIAFFPYEITPSKTSVTFQQVAGDVERFTEYGLMAASEFTPKLRDLVIRSDGTTMKPLGLSALKPGAEVVLYTIGFVG